MGEYLQPYTHPQALSNPPGGKAVNQWSPFNSCLEFDFAYYHFVEVQNLAGLIDKALDLWATTVTDFGDDAP
jgi:hypothetical protein